MRQGRTKTPAAPGTVKRLSKFELKAKRFAKAYIKHGLNGTKAAMEVYEPSNERSASAIASENLTKPVMVTAIQEEMDTQGITDELLLKEHKKVITQDTNLPSKNVAIDMAYKLKGAYAPDRSIKLNVDVPSDIAEAIKALQDELLALQ